MLGTHPLVLHGHLISYTHLCSFWILRYNKCMIFPCQYLRTRWTCMHDYERQNKNERQNKTSKSECLLFKQFENCEKLQFNDDTAEKLCCFIIIIIIYFVCKIFTERNKIIAAIRKYQFSGVLYKTMKHHLV